MIRKSISSAFAGLLIVVPALAFFYAAWSLDARMREQAVAGGNKEVVG